MNAIALALAKYPKAKKIAVENFTMGREGKGMTMADSMNLEMDARLYNWHPHTIKAIKMVIK